MAKATRLNSRLILSAAVCLGLAACAKGSPTQPTVPGGCTYTLSVTSLSMPASGGSNAVGITTTSQCPWTATSDRDWVTLTGAATGTGTGSVTVAIAANPSLSARTGTLTVGGQTMSVSQAANQTCTVTLASSSASFDKNAATGNLALVSPVGCPWTAVSTAPWLTVTSGTPGVGNGSVAYSVDRNPDVTARSAAITVNEKSFAVTQAGDAAACTYSVAPVDFTLCMSVPAETTAMVTTQAICAWTATPSAPWITVTGGQSRIGSGVVSFGVTDNWDGPRYGNVEVHWPTAAAGQNLPVAQAGCSYTVDDSSQLVATAGGPGQFQVMQQSIPIQCTGASQQCQWTAVSNAPWITISTPMPQVGNGTVNFVVAPNTTGAFRTTTITFRDQVVNITQGPS